MDTPFHHRPRRSWTKVTILLTEEHSDIAAAFLAELSQCGVEQSLPTDTGNGATATVTGYLNNDGTNSEQRAALAAFLRRLTGAPPQVRFEELLEEDWGSNWKKHFKPVKVGRHIIVKPSWEPYRPGEDELIIEIDPGLAFGTGLHASTRLALALLEQLFDRQPRPRSILDVGTGTGILAIAALLCGADTALAIDNDPDAVACARENVKANRLEDAITVSGEDLATHEGPYDLVIANITSDILIALAANLRRLTAPMGHLILAGILVGDQADMVRATFSSLGFTVLNAPVEGEWQAFLLAM